MKKLNHDKNRPFLYIAFAVFLIGILLHLQDISKWIDDLLNTLKPFIASICIGYLIYPFCNKVKNILDKIHKFKINWIISVIFSYVVLLALISFGMTYIVPQLYDSIKEIATKLPDYLREIRPWLSKFGISAEYIKGENIRDAILKFIGEEEVIVEQVLNTTTTIIKSVTSTLIAIIFSIYLLMDKDRIFKYIHKVGDAVFGEDRCNKIANNIAECSTMINNFLVGKIIDSVIVGVIVFIILTIMGFQYALLIATIVGLTNVIPDIGPFIGAIPGILIYLSINIKTALIFGLIIFAVQQFDGYVLGPKILGTRLGIRPIVILPSVVIAGHYFGLAGMLLGVPLISTIALYLNRWIETKRKNNDEQKKLDDIKQENKDKEEDS